MNAQKQPTAILIAGPTASGKSSFALKLALEKADGREAVIINTDSMQVYDRLRVITARPGQEDEAQVSHRLYGHCPVEQPYSVAHWSKDVQPVLDDLIANDQIPVFVGGTGLYFKALLEGLSPVPKLDAELRQKWRDFAVEQGDELHARLAELDPEAADILRPSDHQRLIRALEVVESTGKSILEWQTLDKGKALIDGANIRKILMMPERSLLHERINNRFEQMVDEGALEEVEGLLNFGLDPSLSVMKAIGVPQFGSYLRGEITLDEAIMRAKAATRQYAKRQSTWFNNQFSDDWQRV